MLTYGEGVNHGLETHVDLAGTNDLGNILSHGSASRWLRVATSHTHAGVVGLEESDLDALLGKVAFGLGQIERGVVWRGVPVPLSVHSCYGAYRKGIIPPVGQEGDLVSRHGDGVVDDTAHGQWCTPWKSGRDRSHVLSPVLAGGKFNGIISVHGSWSIADVGSSVWISDSMDTRHALSLLVTLRGACRPQGERSCHRICFTVPKSFCCRSKTREVKRDVE